MVFLHGPPLHVTEFHLVPRWRIENGPKNPHNAAAKGGTHLQKHKDDAMIETKNKKSILIRVGLEPTLFRTAVV